MLKLNRLSAVYLSSETVGTLYVSYFIPHEISTHALSNILSQTSWKCFYVVWTFQSFKQWIIASWIKSTLQC